MNRLGLDIGSTTLKCAVLSEEALYTNVCEIGYVIEPSRLSPAPAGA